MWTTDQIPSQSGKRAVVTGGSGGLGLETARALVAKGADVIIAARDRSKAEAARASIGGSCRVEILDLAHLASVHAFTTRLAAQGQAIDLLINNAGLAAPPKRLTTKDGFEAQIGTNLLGHFALTAGLLPLLRQAAAPRVVTLSSIVHKTARIDFDDLMSARRYSPTASYAMSKLACLIFARVLQRRSDAGQWGLRSVAAHPGMARTELTKARDGQPVLWFNPLVESLLPLIGQTAAEGARPTLYAALDAEAEAGGYYGPTGFGEMKGPVGRARSTAVSRDTATGERLWSEAERLTAISFK